ncbi:carbohydrate esterase family 4 protein [Phycomyces blakesleeanus]|uniref:Carbohydrate esterase family 4 protein n=1 Tax=Phycomyces blakesleeanus TaxID=4837 RepID=A0ABR3B7I2_PHYBL
MPVSSPTWLSSVPIPTNVATKFPTDQAIIPGPLAPSDFHINKKTYPAANKVPSVDHPEVQKVIGSIDWTKVSKSPIRKVVDWSLDLTGYDYLGDPDCWSSSSLCRYPKALDLPEDVHECPNSGDWGLSYDDGPFRAWTTSPEDKAWESPRLYNFLATTGNQKATLFYVGHNVINFPVAAQRALADGHTLCAHTWSHKQMTSLTNEEVVAELYWTMKAIKETTGVTTRCWRPPYGDVDDRVRSIAWQMGLRTIVWDRDSNDWDLEHENNREALAVAEEWLPRLQNQFNVVPIHECIGDPNPYWEANWKFPWPAGKFNGSKKAYPPYLSIFFIVK